MTRKYFVFTVAVAMIAAGALISQAAVEWNLRDIVKLDKPPLDVAVAPGGKRIFVLADPMNLHVYSTGGKAVEKIALSSPVDQIEPGPRDDTVVLHGRSNPAVQMLQVAFVADIDASGSPARGPADAPVVIAVYNDFQ